MYTSKIVDFKKKKNRFIDFSYFIINNWNDRKRIVQIDIQICANQKFFNFSVASGFQYSSILLFFFSSFYSLRRPVLQNHSPYSFYYLFLVGWTYIWPRWIYEDKANYLGHRYLSASEYSQVVQIFIRPRLISRTNF